MKKRRVPRILTIFILLGISLIAIPVLQSKATESSLADFQLEGTTLIQYVGTASSVSIPSSVKTIGRNAFEKNTSIKEVTIPSSVTAIEAYAFHECSALEKVNIGNGVETIGNSAFADCENLSSVYLGDKVRSLGSCSFGGCDRLSTIQISANNSFVSCEKGAIYGDRGSILYQVLAGRNGETYTMPDSVTTLTPYCMWGCQNLKTFSFSGGIRKISEYAFYGASGLQFVEIPNSITSIDLRAFGSNYQLEEVMLPLSALSLHSDAFEDCPLLQLVVSPASVGEQYAKEQGIAYRYDSKYKGTYRYDLENQTSSNSGSVSSNNQKPDQEVKYDSSTIKGAQEASKHTENGDIDHLLSDELGKTIVVSGNAFVLMDQSDMNVHDGDEYTSFAEPQTDTLGEKKPYFITEQQVGKHTLYGNCIAENAYYQNSSLGYYIIPKGIESVGDFAFARSSISSVDIPESVTKIGYGAFYHCDSLAYVTLPKSVREIAPYAFDETKWKKDWIAGGSVGDFYITGDGILLFYKGTQENVTIPSDVKYIASGCFRNHTEIKQINLPDEIQTIGEEAFMGCSNLRIVTGGANLESIQDKAFYGCPLDTIRIPATVKEIGLGAFDYSAIDRDAAVAAVFMGKELPSLRVSDTASRWSEMASRKKAFEGVSVAVLWNPEANIQESVLDNSLFGFSGFVCTIYQEASENTTGTLQIVAVSDRAKKEQLPESVWVYGYRYTLMDSSKLLDTLSNEDANQPFVTKVEESANEFSDRFHAEAPMDLMNYQLILSKGDDREAHLEESLKALYGENGVGPISTFSMDLTDIEDTLKIQKLGEHSIKVSMKVPNLLSLDRLSLATEDKDGQLELIPIEITNAQGREVSFEIRHLSPFAFFQTRNMNGEESLNGIEADGTNTEPEQLTIDQLKPLNKEVNPVTIGAFLLAILLVIIATALWFTKKFHKTI